MSTYQEIGQLKGMPFVSMSRPPSIYSARDIGKNRHPFKFDYLLVYAFAWYKYSVLAWYKHSVLAWYRTLFPPSTNTRFSLGD